MKKFFWILLLCLFSIPSFSQDPCDPDFDPFCDDLDAPIDSGVGLLIGATALYTIKRLRDKKENINNKSEIG